MDALKKAEIEMDKAMRKWVDLTYGALAIAFKRYWQWGAKRISNVIEETYAVWDECGETNKISMIQMLENETGIEIRNHEQGKSWRELAFLNAEISMDVNTMTRPQWIVMRQHQTQWMRQQILACVLLGLHRRYGFGTERLTRLVYQINEIVDEFNQKPKKLLEAAYDEAGFVMKTN